MKNIEVIQTLRLYDADFIAKLGTLMQREGKNYRNKNEFLTELMKLGYERYIAIAKFDGAGETDTLAVIQREKQINECSVTLQEITALLTEVIEYLTAQFKASAIYHSVAHKLLSANYRMLLAHMDGENVLRTKIDDGFFDDLPERFEKIIASLETKFFEAKFATK